MADDAEIWPADWCYASLSFFSFFSLFFVLCMAIKIQEWRRRRFSSRGFSLRVRLARF